MAPCLFSRTLTKQKWMSWCRRCLCMPWKNLSRFLHWSRIRSFRAILDVGLNLYTHPDASHSKRKNTRARRRLKARIKRKSANLNRQRFSFSSGDTTRTCVRQLTDMSPTSSTCSRTNRLPALVFSCCSRFIASFFVSKNSTYTTSHGRYFDVKPLLESALWEWNRSMRSELYPI